MLAASFYKHDSVTDNVTESNTMKQLYKIIAVVLCIVLFTACGGKAVNLNVNTDSSTETGVIESSKQENEESSTNQDFPPQQDALTKLDLAKAGNPDTVAWLRIPNTDIDNPIMRPLTMRTI